MPRTRLQTSRREIAVTKLRLCWLWFGALQITAGAPESAAAEDRPETARLWLADRFGVAPLERALTRGEPSDRERAIVRLGELGGPRAVELLVRALEPSGPAQSARERLLCVRALAPHVHETKARDALIRVMTGISVSAELREPIYAMLRDSAALALAASGQDAAFRALGKALRQPGRVARSAASALAAHPPENLSLILAPRAPPTAELVWLLERLGDQRAFEGLRAIVQRGDPDLRARAALALTRLGNFETVALARSWASRTHLEPSLRMAAAEILTMARDASAESAVSALLSSDPIDPDALELACTRPSAALAQTLWGLLGASNRPDGSRIVRGLGRSSDASTLDRLVELVRAGAQRNGAAYALSLSPLPEARTTLERLLDPKATESTRRLAARAGILRRAALGETAAPSNLVKTLEDLLASEKAGDRAVGAFGLSWSDPKRAASLLMHRHPEVVQAAARVAAFSDLAGTAGRLLTEAPEGPTRSQLALCLVNRDARTLVPTRVLLELIAEGGPAAPLALFALGERDSPTLRSRLLEHLSSPDPELRSHAALGLGASTEPSALGHLVAAYRFEVDARVRHALVQAIAVRRESARRRTLQLAARLDPNESVRTLAKLALGEVRPSPWTPGVGTVWLVLDGPERPGKKAVKLELPSGLVVPLLADPDGVAWLGGLPSGSIRLRLARDVAGVQAPLERP